MFYCILYALFKCAIVCLMKTLSTIKLQSLHCNREDVGEMKFQISIAMEITGVSLF